MLFSCKTVEALKDDHDRIRAEVKVLKDPDLTMLQKRNSFNRLIPFLSSHSRREEGVIYSFMKSWTDEALKLMAYHGEVEHKIVDELINQMRPEAVSWEEWSAKASVLTELVERHLDEEEDDVFPSLKKHLDTVTDADLCGRYTAFHEDSMVHSMDSAPRDIAGSEFHGHI